MFWFAFFAAGVVALVGASVRSRPKARERQVITIQLETGSGQLQNGTAEIRLREHFASGTKDYELTAHVVPREGKARGYLYVEEISPNRLVVVESGGGRSDARFDYLIVATQWSGRGREPSQPQ